jgi:hypothetical protein
VKEHGGEHAPVRVEVDPVHDHRLGDHAHEIEEKRDGLGEESLLIRARDEEQGQVQEHEPEMCRS